MAVKDKKRNLADAQREFFDEAEADSVLYR